MCLALLKNELANFYFFSSVFLAGYLFIFIFIFLFTLDPKAWFRSLKLKLNI